MASGMFPYSALLGLTVDTCCCQSTSSWVLSPYTAQCLSSVVHVTRQSTECQFCTFFHREKVDYGSCSRFSTCSFSAHCLVRQRSHAVRQFTEYFIFYVYWGGYGSPDRFSTCSFSAFAWFNSEHKFLRQSTWLVFPGHDAPRAVFLRCPQAPDARHHGRYGPEGQFYARFLVALRCRVVVKVSLLVILRLCMGQRYADEGKIHHQLHPVPLTLSVFACSMIGSAAMTIFAPTTTITFSSS